MIVWRFDLVFELADVEDAVLALYRSASDAAQDGWGAGLIIEDVTEAVAEYFVARLCVHLDAKLIRLCSRRHEQGSLFAQEFRHAFLQAIDRRILAENVV